MPAPKKPKSKKVVPKSIGLEPAFWTFARKDMKALDCPTLAEYFRTILRERGA